MELNKIYNMDCLEGMRQIPDGSIDLVVTSPPYDNLRSYGGTCDWNFDKFKEIAFELTKKIKEGGVIVWIVSDATIDGSETGTSFNHALYFMSIGLKLHDTMIWKKISPFTHENRYISSFEYMFVLSKSSPKTYNLIKDRKNLWGGTKVHGTLQQKEGVLSEINGKSKGRLVLEYGARLNVWDIPAEKNNTTGHPAVFPIEIAHDHIITWCNEGDTVLDPFMGSGTTAIACIREKRNFIGFELNEEYYTRATKRIQAEQSQLTLF